MFASKSTNIKSTKRWTLLVSHVSVCSSRPDWTGDGSWDQSERGGSKGSKPEVPGPGLSLSVHLSTDDGVVVHSSSYDDVVPAGFSLTVAAWFGGSWLHAMGLGV